MEPLVAAGTTISVVANLVEFAKILGKVIHRIGEYKDRLEYAPKIVRDIDAKLGLLQRTVQLASERAKKEASLVRDGNATADTENTGSLSSIYSADDAAEIRKLTEACSAVITDSLLPLLSQVLSRAADSRLRRAARAVRSLQVERELTRTWARVEGFEKGLAAYFAVLQIPQQPLPPFPPADAAARRIFVYPSRLVSNYVERTMESGDTFLAELSRHLSPVQITEADTNCANSSSGGSSSSSGAPRVAVLVGMGGAGKTQLALRYCREVEAQDSCRTLLWIDASSTRAAVKSFHDVARIVAPEKYNKATARVGTVPTFGQMSDPNWSGFNSMGVASGISAPDVTEDAVHDVLKYLQTHGPWTLVFDNYDRPDKFEPCGSLQSLRDYWPRTSRGGGQVLITSRHQQCHLLGRVFQIGRLSESEAVQLLSSSLCSDGEQGAKQDDEAREVVQKLGCLALAVGQACAYIRAQRITAGRFLEHYRDRQKEVLARVPASRDWAYRQRCADGQSDEEVPLSVATTWELSISCLRGTKVQKQLKVDFLSLLGFLEPSILDESLFRRGAGQRDASEPSPSWSRLFQGRDGWDSYLFGDFVSELAELSLVESVAHDDGPDSSSSCHRFSLHPLVSHWARLRQSEDMLRRYASETFILLRRTWEAHFLDPLWDASLLARHATAFVEHVSTCLPNEPPVGLSPLFPGGEFLCGLFNVTHADDALRSLCTHILEWRRRHDRPWCLNLIVSGVFLLYLENRQTPPPDTFDLASELYCAAAEVLGDHDALTLICLSMKGHALLVRNAVDEAERVLVGCYQRHRDIPGLEFHMGATLKDLATVYTAQERFCEAFTCLRTRLITFQHMLGLYNHMTLRAELDVLDVLIKAGEAGKPVRIGDIAGVAHCGLSAILSDGPAHDWFRLVDALLVVPCGRDQLANITNCRASMSVDVRSRLFTAAVVVYAVALGFMDPDGALMPDGHAHYWESAVEAVEVAVGKGSCAKQALKSKFLEALDWMGMKQCEVREIVYWGLYWLYSQRGLNLNPRRVPIVRKHLCEAVQASRELRGTQESVIIFLQFAATGFRCLRDTEMIDSTSRYLLETWEQQPSYQSLFRAALPDDGEYDAAVCKPLPPGGGGDGL
ncbi:hypothetical protein VTK73DRAFT_993 [Phialemonium thermophilum]|uniref:NB-ARC domain-containing protein n=1 Tax=Phialemonium thermophilum TaxID=223376 RepID=A0ABR3VU25_9PEZI